MVILVSSIVPVILATVVLWCLKRRHKCTFAGLNHLHLRNRISRTNEYAYDVSM